MTSRFDRLGTIDRVLLVSLVAVVSTLVFPFSASAQTSNQTPIVFEINSLPTIKIPTVNDIANLSQPATDATPTTPVIDQAAIDAANAQILQSYLEQKGSPLAPFAAEILAQDNWKLIVAISNAESTMCKHQIGHNCWGIGGAWNMKLFPTYDDAIIYVNNLITSKYVADGLDTPIKIVHRYVGSYSPNWVVAATQTLNQLNQLPLQLN